MLYDYVKRSHDFSTAYFYFVYLIHKILCVFQHILM